MYPRPRHANPSLEANPPAAPHSGATTQTPEGSHMPTSPPNSLEAVLCQVDAGLDQSRESLFALLRIPSISAQPAHRQDCRLAAEFLQNQLTRLGFAASLRDTPGHPVVVAHHPGADGYRGPHILFYGHYDVQPPEP